MNSVFVGRVPNAAARSEKPDNYIGVILVLVGIIAAWGFSGCVSRTEYPTGLPSPGQAGRPTDTTYVVVNPMWTEAGGKAFDRPRGVTFGYDRSVYICDTENDRIVRVTVGGDFIEEYPVTHPVQVTQDRQLNLICVDGEGTVCRRRHFGGGQFDTAFCRDTASVFVYSQRLGWDSVLTDSGWNKWYGVIFDTILARIPTGFLGVAASPLTDRYYYVTDSTRNLLSVQDVEDNGIAKDALFPRPKALAPVGVMTYPTGETTYNIVLTLEDSRNPFRIVRSGTFDDVRLGTADVRRDTADIYKLLPRGPKQAARDDDGNFLIVSAVANEAYRFTRHGAHKFTFGGPGSAPGQFNYPCGVAYGEKTVYIADTGNDRIVRLRLSTDLQY